MTRLSNVLFVSACMALPMNAHALDVSVGGISASVGGNGSGGLSAGASIGGSGGVNAGASVGGRSGGGLGADVNASVGGSKGINANTSATLGGGSLTNVDVDASVGGSRGLNVNANVNVGGTKGVGVDVGVGTGPGATNPGSNPSFPSKGVIRAYNEMSRTEQLRLAKRCVDIMNGGYEADLVKLCRMIRTASR